MKWGDLGGRKKLEERKKKEWCMYLRTKPNVGKRYTNCHLLWQQPSKAGNEHAAPKQRLVDARNEGTANAIKNKSAHQVLLLTRHIYKPQQDEAQSTN